MRPIRRGMKRLLVLLAAVLVPVLAIAAPAQAHTPRCTPAIGFTFASTFNGQPTIEFDWNLNCPNSVDLVEMNATNCGSVIGSVQGEVVIPSTNCLLAHQVDARTDHTFWVTWRACANATTHQRIDSGGVNWREHWTSSPTGGPIWTEAFGAYHGTGTGLFFDCTL